MAKRRKASKSGFDYAAQAPPNYFPPNYPGAATPIYPAHAYPTGYAGYMNG